MMRRQIQTRRSRGFTLTEMLIVIAIIGTLAAFLLPAVNKARSRAVMRRTKAYCDQIADAWKGYYLRFRRWPNEDIREMDLTAMNILGGRHLGHNPTGHAFMDFFEEEWEIGETGETGMRDHWGNLYRVALDNGRGWDSGDAANNVQITIPNVGTIESRVAVWSAGPSGQDGTADDIRSWE